jgi:hypothetical protein
MPNNSLIKRILAYSAKKIKANPPLPCSTLNPETSSDSPSAKGQLSLYRPGQALRA